MNKANDLYILTTNVMEGTGFNSFFKQNKPEYEIIVKLFSGASVQPILFDELKTTVKKNSIVIIDTDSFEDASLFDFLLDLYELGVKCIIYSRLTSPGLLIKVKKLSVDGYVSKSSPVERLLYCLNVIELGGTYYDSCFSDLLKQIMLFENNLSVSEKKLLEEVLLFSNRTIRELSETMHISKHTAEVHLSNIYKKAGVSCYNELVSKFSL